MTTSLPSLLEPEAFPEAPVRARRRPLKVVIRERWARLDPGRRRRLVLAGRIALGLAVVGGGIGAYFALRPVPKPDYETAPIDEIFSYTLLTEEFNRLPVEERVRLVGQIVQRIKTMGSSDSALLAAFAAGIMGQAREQLQHNASRLAVDLWDKYAVDYSRVPEAERDEYLDTMMVEFTRTMEGVAGESRDVSDEERLGEMREQARRDQEALRDPERAPTGRQMSRMFTFMNEGVGSSASPAQRVRGQQLMRDVVRHFRGEDLITRKPK